jgi:hypothetical protein
MSASCRISFFLIWLLVGRENLEDDEIEDGEIEDGEIEDDKIRDDKKSVETADCEKFFFNYIDRCAVSVHSANLIIDKAIIEIANTYWFWIYRIRSGSFFNNHFWRKVISLIFFSNSISYSKKILNR